MTRTRLWKQWPVLLFGVGGMVFALHAMMLTGLDRVPRDWGDTRFVNYVLEHGYRWLLRRPNHQSFWDGPFFHPAPGVLAYSESMFGAGPFYWIWRVLSIRSDTAFQLWLISLYLLNFASAHLLLRRCFKLSVLGSALGAFFFAYANARTNQLMHHQLAPHFYSVFALYALFRFFEPLPEETSGRALLRGISFGSREDRHRLVWAAVFFASVSLQLYASFYLGWFLLFSLLLAVLVGAAFPAARERVLKTWLRYPGVVLLCAVVATAVTAPMVLRYLAASREVGMRSFGEVLTMLPPPLAWMDLGPDNWMYKSWYGLFTAIPMEHEQRLGFGVVTTLACLAGLFFARKRPAVALFAVTSLLLFTLMTWWAPGIILWKVVYAVVPGAGAIRAVSRMGLQLLIPVSLGVALLNDFLTARKLQWLALALGGVAVLEQFNDGFTFSKSMDRRDIQQIVSNIPPGCEAFYFSGIGGRGPAWKYQNDAMMASLAADKPTFNGYSGNAPPGWALNDVNLWSEADAQRANAALQAWIAQKGLDPAKTCWVRVRLNDGNNAAQVLGVEVPRTLAPGQRFEAKLKLHNIGFHPWSPATRHRLGSQSPQDNRVWGTNRLELPGRVLGGEEVTVKAELTAPSAPGSYVFQWQMVQDGVEWFGAMTEPISILVQ